jgi:hypothetical protein
MENLDQAGYCSASALYAEAVGSNLCRLQRPLALEETVPIVPVFASSECGKKS